MFKKNIDPILLNILVIGFIWARSSWGKFTSDEFSKNFASTVSRFVAKNPYPWFKDFLENTVLANSSTFSFLVMWGELLSALSIVGGSAFLIMGTGGKKAVVLLAGGLLVGAFLSATFWFAAGWTSPSTDGLNLLMFAVEVVGLIYCLKLLKAK